MLSQLCSLGENVNFKYSLRTVKGIGLQYMLKTDCWVSGEICQNRLNHVNSPLIRRNALVKLISLLKQLSDRHFTDSAKYIFTSHVTSFTNIHKSTAYITIPWKLHLNDPYWARISPGPQRGLSGWGRVVELKIFVIISFIPKVFFYPLVRKSLEPRGSAAIKRVK